MYATDKGNYMHVLWQLPQYVFIVLASTIFFSMTVQFSFTEVSTETFSPCTVDCRFSLYFSRTDTRFSRYSSRHSKTIFNVLRTEQYARVRLIYGTDVAKKKKYVLKKKKSGRETGVERGYNNSELFVYGCF